MPSFALLDVAIALCFLYLLLSLIASAANEIISALFQMRAKLLEAGVARLLDSEDLKKQLYEHPLLRNLHSYDEPWLLQMRTKKLPSYIPARSFALALMDLIEPGTGTRNALLVPEDRLKTDVQAAESTLLATIKAAESILPPKPRQALICLIEATGSDAVRVRESIEHWYDATMERVSGAYKRRTQFAIFCIGLVATIAVNADSISVAKRLASNKMLSEAIVTSASTFVQSSNPNATPENRLEQSVGTLDRLSFPIGWTELDVPGRPDWGTLIPQLLYLHLAGWIVTAFAISFGAPFWFDVLNKFMVVRSTVKPQEKSGPEAPKDPPIQS